METVPSGSYWLRVSYDKDNLVKVERGNKATDYTIAPEDVDQTILDTQTTIEQNVTNKIDEAKSDVLGDVDLKYATKDEVSTISETLTTSIEQTNSDISFVISDVKTVTDKTTGLEEHKTKVETHIQFDIDGMKLGKEGSPFTTRLDDTKLAFQENGVDVAWIEKNSLFVSNAEIQGELKISNKNVTGSFSWTQGSNGNMSLKWGDS
jgi:hypothetical protein